MKVKLLFKWFFVFSVLIVWSYFVISNVVTGSFAKDFNFPVYLQTPVGIERASSSEVLDFLFNHNFEIQKKIENIPEDKCSLRAENGNLIINEKDLGNKNKLSFHINFANNKGEGSLIGQKDRDRLSLSFDFKNLVKIDLNELILEASGKGNLNKEKLNFNSITLTLDKINKKISVSGDGLEATDMDASFIDGCGNEEKEFYVFVCNGLREERRSIEEVRMILDENPELIDMYGTLERLYKDYWWLILPEGFGIS